MLYILDEPLNYKSEVQKRIVLYWMEQQWAAKMVKYIGYTYPAVFPPKEVYQKHPKIICDGGYDRFMGYTIENPR